MYEITIQRVFSAAHAIRLYDGTLEPLHGHDWDVAITVASAGLDDIEVVMDFHRLERTVADLLKTVNNRNLNEIEPFNDGQQGLAINPTAERVAWWIATEIAPTLPDGVELVKVSVGEAPGCTATYRPE